jgi:outer membrane protein
MKKIIGLTIGVLLLMSAGIAAAEGTQSSSIKGRLGITGQVGFIMPSNSDFTNSFAAANGLASTKLEKRSDFAGGGGLIFGLTDNLAIEAQALHVPGIEYTNTGVKVLEITTTNLSLGLQLRSNVDADLAAYLGAGVDWLINDVVDGNNNEGNINSLIAGHVNVGGDYFFTKNVALNLDLRGVFGPTADIKNAGGVIIAEYNPISFVGLVGVRVFLY